jgi:hypothetical protein
MKPGVSGRQLCLRSRVLLVSDQTAGSECMSSLCCCGSGGDVMVSIKCRSCRSDPNVYCLFGRAR